MSLDEEREEIGQRLERRADRFRNAGDEAAAAAAEGAAARVRQAATLAAALAIEAGLAASAPAGGFWQRLWGTLTGRGEPRDDS